MAKSFFERLTGSIRINENEEGIEPVREARAAAPVRPVRRRAQAPAEEKSRVIHPVAADEETGAEAAEAESGEEGQLTVDIFDDGSHIVIQSSMAGVKPEDIDISLQEETLTIRGRRERVKEISEGNFYYRELYWGSFSRAIILPEEVDFPKADAALKNGLLTIRLPKKDRSEKKIRVKFE